MCCAGTTTNTSTSKASSQRSCNSSVECVEATVVLLSLQLQLLLLLVVRWHGAATWQVVSKSCGASWLHQLGFNIKGTQVGFELRGWRAEVKHGPWCTKEVAAALLLLLLLLSVVVVVGKAWACGGGALWVLGQHNT